MDADLIVHVRDISHNESDQQAQDVHEILDGLGVGEDAPILEVWNKIDLLSEEDHAAALHQVERREDLFAISAITGEGLTPLLEAITAKLRDPMTDETLTIPFSEGKRRAWLFEAGVVTSETAGEDGHILNVTWSKKQKAQFKKQ